MAVHMNSDRAGTEPDFSLGKVHSSLYRYMLAAGSLLDGPQ